MRLRNPVLKAPGARMKSSKVYAVAIALGASSLSIYALPGWGPSEVATSSIPAVTDSENVAIPEDRSTLIQQPPRASTQSGLQDKSVAGSHERMHFTILRTFREAIGKNWMSTIRVIGDGHQVAMGAMVDSEGYAITKASELPQADIECRLYDGAKVNCRVVSTRTDIDLALLKVERKGLPIVDWSITSQAEVGAWIASTDFKEIPLAIGVVSVAPRAIRQEKAVLGISFDTDANQQIVVKMVLEGSGAHRAGIRKDDLILAVNGSKVTTRQALLDTIASMRAGQEIELEIARKEKTKTVRAELMDLHNSLLDPTEMEVNGRISARSTGFASVFQHDTVLMPNQCGGPVVDLNGKVVGINIARAGRVSSYALPTSVVRPVVEEMLANAKGSSFATKPSDNAIIRLQDTTVPASVK